MGDSFAFHPSVDVGIDEDAILNKRLGLNERAVAVVSARTARAGIRIKNYGQNMHFSYSTFSR